MKTHHIYSAPECVTINLWLGQRITVTSDVDSDAENIDFFFNDGSDD